ncbi:hypothetical protein [Saccharomonospora piscinae]|uniref:hypothetical protein n=1 Tax=Saccharomonospora piscinae TaxID=687388 RepID=UPI00111BE452|nr:hypothetical protein [Saccharomonospora piscinae]
MNEEVGRKMREDEPIYFNGTRYKLSEFTFGNSDALYYPSHVPSNEEAAKETRGLRSRFLKNLRRLLHKRLQWQRRRRFVYRVSLSLLLGAIAVVLVGIIGRFYELPLADSNPAQMARQPWLPPEIIESDKEPGGSTVGYVLSTADDWFTVLVEKSRTIKFIRAKDVKSRRVCSLDSKATDSRSPLYRLEGMGDKGSPPCVPT